MPLPDEFIYQLKLANPIDTTMGRYVHLIRSGSNYKCLCPFHSEKTPSCTVYTGTQSFYCFGCGAGGDVITFTKQIENLDTYEAIKLLAERGGLEMPENDLNKDGAKLKLRILEMNREAANFFYRNLLQGQDKRGLQYAVQRGLTPKAIKKYAIGYAPAAWDGLMKHLEGLGFTREEMLSAGLIRQNARGCFDFFRERVMFPIIDLRGDVIGFGGRVLGDGTPKYLNSPDSVVFNKSRNLFALNLAKNTKLGRIILTEGYMDTISLYQAGFKNVVASMGTSLTTEQARLIRRYTDKVYISYDGDFAGQSADLRGLEILKAENLTVRVVPLPDGQDPDDVAKEGAAAYQKCLDAAVPLIDYKLLAAGRKYDLKKSDEKRAFVAEALKIVREAETASEREELLKQLRDKTGITLQSLERDLSDLPAAQAQSETAATKEAEEGGDKFQRAERFILAAKLFSAPYAKDFDLNRISFTDETRNTIAKYVLTCEENGEKIRPSDLFDVLEADSPEFCAILDLNYEDELESRVSEKFFADSVATLEKEAVQAKIKALSEKFSAATELKERQQIAAEIGALTRRLKK